jgi:hypothetical protein
MAASLAALEPDVRISRILLAERPGGDQVYDKGS